MVTVSAPEVLPVVIEPNAKGDGDAVNVTVAAIPAPDSGTVPEALPGTFKVADRVPGALGVMVMMIVHAEPGPSEEVFVHVPPVWAKLAACAPVNVMLVSTRFAVPVLVTVTVCVGAALPTMAVPKFTNVGDSPIPGTGTATPCTCMATVFVAVVVEAVRLAVSRLVVEG